MTLNLLVSCLLFNEYKKISDKNNSWIKNYVVKHKFKRFSYLNNRFSSLLEPMLTYQYDYFPCSPACKSSVKISSENREILKRSDLLDFIPLIDKHMQSYVISYKDMIWYIPRHILNDNDNQIIKNFQRPLSDNDCDDKIYLKKFDSHNKMCEFELKVNFS